MSDIFLLFYGGNMNTNLKEKMEYAKIIDAKIASQILGVSRSTIYKMVERKLIDYIEYEYPYAIRFYENDVLEYLKNHKIKAIKDL